MRMSGPYALWDTRYNGGLHEGGGVVIDNFLDKMYIKSYFDQLT